MAFHAVSCLRGPAFVWFSKQPQDVQDNWRNLRKSLLDRFEGDIGIGAPHPACAALTDSRPTVHHQCVLLMRSNAHRVERGWQIKYGMHVFQTTADGRNILLSTMSPYGQFVVLQTLGEPELPGVVPLAWPIDIAAWRIVWKSHEVQDNEGEDLNSVLIFQDDGNIVIYSGKGGRVLWASNTCHHDGCRYLGKFLQWGTGVGVDPYIFCQADNGCRIWCTW